jgi:hypothetical protein
MIRQKVGAIASCWSLVKPQRDCTDCIVARLPKKMKHEQSNEPAGPEPQPKMPMDKELRVRLCHQHIWPVLFRERAYFLHGVVETKTAKPDDVFGVVCLPSTCEPSGQAKIDFDSRRWLNNSK